MVEEEQDSDLRLAEFRGNFSTSNNVRMDALCGATPLECNTIAHGLRRSAECDPARPGSALHRAAAGYGANGHFDWGFRLAGLWGLDYRFTTASGIFSQQLLSRNKEYGDDPVMVYVDLYFPQVAQGMDFVSAVTSRCRILKRSWHRTITRTAIRCCTRLIATRRRGSHHDENQ